MRCGVKPDKNVLSCNWLLAGGVCVCVCVYVCTQHSVTWSNQLPCTLTTVIRAASQLCAMHVHVHDP